MNAVRPDGWEPDPETEVLVPPTQLVPGHYVRRSFVTYPYHGWYRVQSVRWKPHLRAYHVKIDRPDVLRNHLADHFRLSAHSRIAARTVPTGDTALLVPVWRRLALQEFDLGCVTDPPLASAGFRAVSTPAELAELVVGGPWRAGTAFHHDGVCVVLCADGEDTWLVLSHDTPLPRVSLEDAARRDELHTLWPRLRPERYRRTPRPTLIAGSSDAVALWTHGDSTARIWLTDDAEDHRGPRPDLNLPMAPGTPFRQQDLERALTAARVDAPVDSHPVPAPTPHRGTAS